jgi:hypothetical protein
VNSPITAGNRLTVLALVTAPLRGLRGRGRVHSTSCLVLPDGATWSAAVAGPAPLVTVVAGTVWVTQAGDRNDHVLGPGEQLALLGRGRVAFLALDGPASMRVQDLQEP